MSKSGIWQPTTVTGEKYKAENLVNANKNTLNGAPGGRGYADNVKKYGVVQDSVVQEKNTDSDPDDAYKWYFTNVAGEVQKELFKNPLETDWGKALLDAYGVKGYNAGQGVKATTAAENAGNIDSYAAANAERQRAAKLGQGVEAIMGLNEQRNSNLLSFLNNLGVNTSAMFGSSESTTDSSEADSANIYKNPKYVATILEDMYRRYAVDDTGAYIADKSDIIPNKQEIWDDVKKAWQSNPNTYGLYPDEILQQIIDDYIIKNINQT